MSTGKAVAELGIKVKTPNTSFMPQPQKTHLFSVTNNMLWRNVRHSSKGGESSTTSARNNDTGVKEKARPHGRSKAATT